VIGPLQPPHFSALPLLAHPRGARPHEPLCCCCRPASHHRPSCCKLLSSTTHTPPVCRHHRNTRTPLPPRPACVLLPKPARQPFYYYCLDGSTPGIDRVAIRPSPSTGPRERDRGHFLPASLHQTPIGATSTSRAPTHSSSTTDSTQHIAAPHHILLPRPFIAKRSLAPPALHSLRRRP
jgi:hypothetical protein